MLNHGSRIVTDGLVLCLDAANPKSYPGSGNTWYDLSGNGNDGTLVNGVGYDSGNGGSMVFDGVNDYINLGSFSGNFISNSSINSDIISFSVWSFIEGGYYILSSGSQTGSVGISFSYQNGSPFATVKGENQFAHISPFDFPLSEWHHWFFVSDGITLKGYIDGVLFDSVNFASTTENDSHTLLTIGTPNNRLGYYMINGNISNVLIYNRALIDSEIKQNFEATRSRYGI